VGHLDESNEVCTYHHGHGEGDGGNLANEEKSGEEREDGRGREEHGCWEDGQGSRRLEASGGAERQSM